MRIKSGVYGLLNFHVILPRQNTIPIRYLMILPLGVAKR